MRTAAHAAVLLVAVAVAAADQAQEIAVAFIAEREGFRADAYCDEAGNATIGYGHLLAHDCDDLEQYEPETEESARGWLVERVAHVLADVRYHVTADLTPRQEAALASLAYNIGAYALDGSMLLMMVNGGQPHGEIVGEWSTWSKEHRGGRLVLSRGLSERRALEIALYLQDWVNEQ